MIAARGNRCLSFEPEAYPRNRIGKSVIVCRDGYRLSVIAGPGTRCQPRPALVDRPEGFNDRDFEVSPLYNGPYHAVEVRLYGAPPTWWPLLFLFGGGDGGDPAEVPVPLVRHLINEHGGFARMEGDPERLAELKADFAERARFCAKYRLDVFGAKRPVQPPESGDGNPA